jgi:Domain of unknown function (DUF5664)
MHDASFAGPCTMMGAPTVGATRHDAGKPDMSLVDFLALTAVAPMRDGITMALRRLQNYEDAPPALRDRHLIVSAMRELADTDQAAAWADCARVMAFGAEKYGCDNWRRGMPFARVKAAIGRHALAVYSGQENDAESGLPHRSHILCNLMFLYRYHDMLGPVVGA